MVKNDVAVTYNIVDLYIAAESISKRGEAFEEILKNHDVVTTFGHDDD